jgi:paraquat-inducible protein B
MSETRGENAAEAVVQRRRGISAVWAIPIVAVVVALSLAYEAITSRGPEIAIRFESGEGLEPGKSKVKFREVEIGSVDSIELGADHVMVHCSLVKSAEPHLKKGANFWVVRPRVGAGGITGLGTIVSGSYIALELGPEDAARERRFVGLEEPPVTPAGAPGLRITLHTDNLGSLGPGDPIYYRHIRAGTIERSQLSEDAKRIDLDAFIDPAYAHLVQNNSRFWNAGGLELHVGGGGLDVKTESLVGMLAGGVSFDAPAGGKPAEAGASYWLHGSYADIEATAMRYGGLGVILEAPALGGIKDGDYVYYREVPVGSVVSHELASDRATVRVRLNILNRYASLVRSNTVFWNASGISADLGLTGLHIHAESLQALLSGGIAFATPDRMGERVKDGSVFKLHPEVKDEWLDWKAGSKAEEKQGEGRISRFFHHRDKSEEETAAERARDVPKEHEEKHGFLRGLLHRGD